MIGNAQGLIEKQRNAEREAGDGEKLTSKEKEALRKVKAGQSLALASWASAILERGKINGVELARLMKLTGIQFSEANLAARHPGLFRSGAVVQMSEAPAAQLSEAGDDVMYLSNACDEISRSIAALTKSRGSFIVPENDRKFTEAVRCLMRANGEVVNARRALSSIRLEKEDD